MFAYHTEDMFLYSINYLHHGAPKSWYVIPPKYMERFDTAVKSHFQQNFQICGEYLRHKNTLISHTKLKDQGITVNTIVQNAGEFVITFPKSYHAGFNHGFYLAEATNFAMPEWIEIGKTAKICMCEPNQVMIDMEEFETLYRRALIQYSKKVLKKAGQKLPKGSACYLHDPLYYRCACGLNEPFDDVTSRERIVVGKGKGGNRHKVFGDKNDSDIFVVNKLKGKAKSKGNGDSSIIKYQKEWPGYECKKCGYFVHNECMKEMLGGGDLNKQGICYVCDKIDKRFMFLETLNPDIDSDTETNKSMSKDKKEKMVKREKKRKSSSKVPNPGDWAILNLGDYSGVMGEILDVRVESDGSGFFRIKYRVDENQKYVDEWVTLDHECVQHFIAFDDGTKLKKKRRTVGGK